MNRLWSTATEGEQLRLSRPKVLSDRLLRDATTVVSVVYLLWVWQFVVAAGSHVDADAYRLVDIADPYALADAGTLHAFLYSPVAAQLLQLVNWLPAPLFYAGLACASIGSLVYLVGPRWAAAALVIPGSAFWQDLLTGNIHLILAAAVVVGLQRPVAWSLVLLTKVTPGIALVWFAVRREWRALILAGGVTLTLIVTSAALAPELWGDWLTVLIGNSSMTPQGGFVPIPLVARLPIALVLVIWGARTSRPWTVPAAAALALPIIWLFDGFAMFAGVAGVWYHSRKRLEQTDAAAI
jgi:hypothetical protein